MRGSLGAQIDCKPAKPLLIIPFYNIYCLFLDNHNYRSRDASSMNSDFGSFDATETGVDFDDDGIYEAYADDDVDDVDDGDVEVEAFRPNELTSKQLLKLAKSSNNNSTPVLRDAAPAYRSSGALGWKEKRRHPAANAFRSALGLGGPVATRTNVSPYVCPCV